MYKERYIFPAIFDFADDGISIEFPDLPGCLPSAHNEDEALNNAKEALALHLYGMEQDKESIPEPSKIKDIHVESNQVVVMIEAWMPPFRDHMQNKAVKKTLTIPKWLNDAAENQNINFSHLLQDALKRHLGINK